MKKNETNEQKPTAEMVPTPQPVPVPVLTRFYREELDDMKADTGATADATAVACFCRKNLRKRG